MFIRFRRSIILIIIVLLFFGLAFLPFSRGVVRKVSSPIFSVLGSAVNTVKSPFRALSKISQLSKKNKELETENQYLESQIAKLEVLQRENEVLRYELGYKKNTPDRKFLLAKIVGGSPEIYLKTLILSQGSSDGATVGQAVVSQGFLVGKIESVEQKTSAVKPILAHNFLIPVTLTKSGGTGILRGGLGGLILENVPLDVPVEIGEPVVTSGIAGEIIEDIPVGQVSAVETEKGDIFQKITVVSPLVFNRLQWVLIIL